MRALLNRIPAQFSGSVAGFALLTVLKAIGGLIILKVMASQLGPEAFGQLGQLMTVVAITSMFAGGGITQALIQNLAGADSDEERQRRLGAALKIYLAEASIVAIILVVFSHHLARFLLNRDDLAWLFWILAATQWLVGANNILQALLSALHNVRAIIIINALGILAGVGLFLLLLMDSYFVGATLGLVFFPAATGLIGVIAAPFVLPASWRRVILRTQRDDMKALLSYSLVMLVTVTAVPLAQLTVRDLLGDALNWSYVGYWQGVLKISDTYMQFLGMLLIYYALPRFSAQPDSASLDKVFRSMRWPLFALMAAGMIFLFLIREPVIRLLFSADFLPARDYFLPQMIGDLMRVLSLIYVYYAVSRGARLMPIVLELVQAAGLVVFSLLLISKFHGLTPVYAHALGCAVSLVTMVGMHQRRVRRAAAAANADAKRILLVCSKFSLDEANGWLTNDLAQQLSKRGHAVDVLHLDWSGNVHAHETVMYGNVNVTTIAALRVPAFLPAKVKNVLKWLFSSYVAARWMKRHRPDRAYGLIIGFSPAIVTHGLLRALARPGQHRYMILWDFFPRYHAELGMLPERGMFYRVAKRLEAAAIRMYHTVGCMSPGNVDFLRRYHNDYSGTAEVLPLWGPASAVDTQGRDAMRTHLGLGEQDVACVFGGQLIPGRGIEHIFTLAKRVRDTLPQVQFIIAGSGPLQGDIESRLASGEFLNVHFVGQLPRHEYLALLAAGDIGLVFNSGHVSVPTFPSKSIDYFRASLPILGAVEAASDYSAIIEEIGAGFSTTATDMDGLEAGLTKLATSPALRQQCGQRGFDYFQRSMTAERIVAQLERYFP